MLRSGSNQLVAACALLALTTAAAREAELKPALVRRPIQAEPAEGFKPQSGRSAELGEQLLADCRDGHLEQFDLLSAGAIASGVNSSTELAQLAELYGPIRKSILDNLPAGTGHERLRAIHAAAHRWVLTGLYNESASDLRGVFASGDFNCLTSLAILWDLCQAAGLDVQGRLVRGHVNLTYKGAGGQSWAIEPGTRQWFSKPLADETSGRGLSQVELIGKFFYNRGIEQLHARKYEAGIELLRTSLQLDSADGDARTNLAAGLNNWAVERCREQRFSEAAALIEQGLTIDPHFAPLVANEQLVRGKLGR